MRGRLRAAFEGYRPGERRNQREPIYRRWLLPNHAERRRDWVHYNRRTEWGRTRKYGDHPRDRRQHASIRRSSAQSIVGNKSAHRGVRRCWRQFGVYVKNTKSVNNAFGIRSIGPNVTVRVDGSAAIGNSTGLSFSGGGALLTAGNNMVRTNGTDGAFSGPVALQ
jgi:hypothetical protein